MLKFYGRFGRFPRGRTELHPDAVEFVAKQLGVDASTLGFYEWSGRTIKRHRAEIRAHLGFRECTVADAEELTGWLAGDYARRNAGTNWSGTPCWPSAGPGRSSRRPRIGW